MSATRPGNAGASGIRIVGVVVADGGAEGRGVFIKKKNLAKKQDRE